MFRTYTVSFAAATLLVIMSFAQGQTTRTSISINSTLTLSAINSDYDFELYARSKVPKIKYFIVYTLADGTTSEDGPIESYDSAARQIFFNYEQAGARK